MGGRMAAAGMVALLAVVVGGDIGGPYRAGQACLCRAVLYMDRQRPTEADHGGLTDPLCEGQADAAMVAGAADALWDWAPTDGMGRALEACGVRPANW